MADEESPLLAPPDPKPHNAKRSDALIIYGTFLGVFVASADESLVLSTYSTIASQFHQLSAGSWLLVAYNFGYCVSLPVYGALSDSYGRKNVLLSSYLFFTLGCLACGASSSLTQLVLARVIAGLSGAGMVAMVSMIIMDLMPPSEVAIYRSYENLVNIFGRSLGAPIGGFLIDAIGWRWSFFGQIPFIIICTLVAVYGLPASLNETQSDETPPSSSSPDESQDEPAHRTRLGELDFAGLISFSATIIALLFLLQAAGEGAADEGPAGQKSILALALTFVLCGVAFVMIEVFWARRPLIPMDLLSKKLGAYCLIQTVLFTGRSAFNGAIVPYFIRVENASEFAASAAYILNVLGASMGGIFAGLVIKRTRRYKTMTALAYLLTIVCFLLVLLLWRTGCSIADSLLLLPSGFAVGIIFSTSFIGMSSSSPRDSLSICIGTYYLFQQLGLIIGPACGSAMIQSLFERELSARLVGPGKKEVWDRYDTKIKLWYPVLTPSDHQAAS
ncbi:hypothetical protein ASPZODRAFT_129457 [Penicilliopsis zonata CBS 506.65]|uniref:Major facilitator superfamily (MFS) profile domain-containing protein n=1 Tax=Penicilliopsis zonata CBS 506.65 TaxID=1073090 RepID=A0A1L9SPQ7_9EURO|nr:hypothetical protein ASPZODRAFT_129457 [Penicilliopsis zonata CBS 506.65]OJJ49073.1 hypothetical protein ASPZODRAFT_129457 [Penicilliopsis zonata CBS 506.65]